MAFSYDPTTDRGKVRLLIGDTDTVNISRQLFADAEIDTFLVLNDNDGSLVCLLLAAAMAKETTAGNQVMLLKVCTRLDVSVDGAAVARELRLQAGELRDQAKRLLASDEGIEIAQMALSPWGVLEQYEAARLSDT